jgi:uncharacterized damage-inducible protein DinB
METVEHLRGLFVYNDWANWRIIRSLGEFSSAECLRILAHLLITEKEYFERHYGKDSTGFDFWQELSLADCADLARETAQNYERLLKRFDEEGLSLRARYKTSEGAAHENTFRELLSHVLVHSATHRGNIVRQMRAENIAPPKVDYIIYLRETKYV